MHFLKTLFWVVLAVVGAIFAYRNWIVVPVGLWGGLTADVRLPVLMVIAFVLGFAPMFVLYRAHLWRVRRRLEATQRSLDEARVQVTSIVTEPQARSGAHATPVPPANQGPQPEFL